MRAMTPRASAVNLVVVSVSTLAGAMAFVALWPRAASLSAEGRIAVATSAQVVIGGAVPIFLMRARRERFEWFGFVSARLILSLLLAVAAAALYDASVSVARSELASDPFGRHGVMRLGLSLAWPWGLLATAAVVLVWGVLEGFFAIYFAVKAQAAVGAPGRAPWAGALAFGAYNALVHAALGQSAGIRRVELRVRSPEIPAVLALTGNAWGGTLVQVLTNAVGSRAEAPLTARRSGSEDVMHAGLGSGQGSLDTLGTPPAGWSRWESCRLRSLLRAPHPRLAPSHRPRGARGSFRARPPRRGEGRDAHARAPRASPARPRACARGRRGSHLRVRRDLLLARGALRGGEAPLAARLHGTRARVPVALFALSELEPPLGPLGAEHKKPEPERDRRGSTR